MFWPLRLVISARRWNIPQEAGRLASFEWTEWRKEGRKEGSKLIRGDIKGETVRGGRWGWKSAACLFHAVPAPLRLNPPGRSSDLRASVPHGCMDGAGRTDTHTRIYLLLSFLNPLLKATILTCCHHQSVGIDPSWRHKLWPKRKHMRHTAQRCTSLAVPSSLACCSMWTPLPPPLPSPPLWWCPAGFCLPLRLISRPVSWLGVDSNLCLLVCVAADGRAQASFCERGPVYLAVTAQGILFASLFKIQKYIYSAHSLQMTR